MQYAATLQDFSKAAPEAQRVKFGCHAKMYSSMAEIERDWRDLEKRSNRPTGFQSLAWCQEWLKAASNSQQPTDLRVVTVWEDGRLALLWPLAVRNSMACTVLHALGDPATQYCDAIIEQKADRQKLMQVAWNLVESLRDIDLIELRRIRGDSNLSTLPLRATRNGFVSNPAAAPYLTLDTDEVLRGSRTRNALRRHARKLAEHGAVDFEIIKDVGAKVQTLMDGMRFKLQWIAQRKLWSNGYSHPATEQFSNGLAALDQVIVMRLTVGGVTAAMEMGFVDHGCYLSLMQSYDPQLQSHSPGRLLFWRFLDCASDLGIKDIDFLAPSFPHKKEWANGEVPVRDLTIPLTVRGTIFGRARLSCRAPLKRLFATLPAPIRQQVFRMMSHA